MPHRKGARVPVLFFLVIFPVAKLTSGPPPPETAPPIPSGWGDENHTHKRRNPGGREYRTMMRDEEHLLLYLFRTHPPDFHMIILPDNILHPIGGTFSPHSLPKAVVFRTINV
jgi:hypothetical protein